METFGSVREMLSIIRNRISRKLALAPLAALALAACGSSHAGPDGAEGGAGTGAAGVGGGGAGADGGAGTGTAGAPPDASDAPTATGDGGVQPADVRRGRLAAGADFTCALSADGKIACWGQTSPMAVPTGAGFTFIAAGYAHACAVGVGGAITCWNARGSANLDIEDDMPPGPFREVAVGGDETHEFACALDMTGAPKCWRSHTVSPALALTTPPAGVHLSHLDLSSTHACGLDAATSHAVCWGSDQPYAMAPDKAFVDVGTGGGYSCGVATDGTLTCWGTTSFGTDYPATLHGVAIGAATSGQGRLTCVLLDLGRAWCGAGYPGSADKTAVFEEVSVGVGHVCGVTRGRTVQCWSNGAPGSTTQPPAGLTLPAR
jgi:Regulator of chromosome condensation (RCC1) repeat